jgi:hypothetical protein
MFRELKALRTNKSHTMRQIYHYWFQRIHKNYVLNSHSHKDGSYNGPKKTLIAKKWVHHLEDEESGQQAKVKALSSCL